MSRALILGAGPAGSSAAIALAHRGTPPVIVERSRETGDAICGGFLSWRTLGALKALGVDAAMLGGQHVTRVRLFAGGQCVDTALPEPGMGVSRHRLDTVLLDRAIAAGAAVERGVTVRTLVPGRAEFSDGGGLAAPAILFATGKHGLKDWPRVPVARIAADPVVGLRQRLSPSAALTALIGDAVELFLFDGGYIGLVRQEDGSGNLCMAVHKSRLSAAGGDPSALIARLAADMPALGDRIAAAGAGQTSQIDAIAGVPYGWRTAATPDGIWRLGDQAACIPSLAGEGMGIAIASAASAVAALQAGTPAPHWQADFARQVARPMGLAGLLWRLGENGRINAPAVALLRAAPGLLHIASRMTRVRAPNASGA